MSQKGKQTPQHKVTETSKAEVMALKSFGITHEDIAKHIGISPDSLVTHYQYELDTAKTKAVQQVAGRLFKKATVDEDLTAIIFYLKTQGRWKTEDNRVALESNDELKAELKALREKLDAQNRREY